MPDIKPDLVKSIPANVSNTLSIDFNGGGVQQARSYAGHVHIAEPESTEKKNHLFYWFFESQTCNPRAEPADQQDLISGTPLLIWLNGGPGASSLLGLFLENGPLSIGPDAAGTVSVTSSSWNQEAHVIYWDQPVGTGYSFSDNKKYVTDAAALTEMFWQALQEFFDLHPEYLNCPLYVCGESYAGKYVPAIALRILEKNEKKAGKQLNLQGIAVGNGWIQPLLSLRILIGYSYASGFVGISQKESLEKEFKVVEGLVKDKKMKEAKEAGDRLINHALGDGGGFDIYDVRRWEDLPAGALKFYLNTTAVKSALHVLPDYDTYWDIEDNKGPVTDHLINDNMLDYTDKYKQLIQKGCKTLLYTGNFDTACGYQSTEEILDQIMKELGDQEHGAWRNAQRIIWTQAQGVPKGYVRRYKEKQAKGKDLTQVSIPHSGHQVPAYQPEVCREMLYNWIFDRPFHGYDPQSLKDGGNAGQRKK
ncbi:S10 family peptidase [Actinomadura terrae]|uniref:S10 family peptidase n=1 Tax=Actinomadura terrae TaxID=604353 RepID=UPI001FA80A5D|nr:S10 family peptidase [Actinomadura terrae]